MNIVRLILGNRLSLLGAILLATYPALAGDIAYTYDNLQRLIRAVDSDGTRIEYSYDAAGNRTSHIVQSAVASFTLTLAKSGTGSGTVGGGGTYAGGAVVALGATADAGSTFAGWSPAPCAASFAMPSADLTCTAAFTLNRYAVTGLAGANGRIDPATQTVDHGAAATFTVTPDVGYIAAASGCGGTLAGNLYTTAPIVAPCTVTASFARAYALSVAKSGTGSGTVAGPGIDCGNDCKETYASGTQVPLAANPAAGSTFAGWSGSCTGTGACNLTFNAAKAVTATFRIKTYLIAATASPLAGGTVTCTPNPVSHGGKSACSATPKTGYAFSGFSGACSGPTCTLTDVVAAQSVTGNFAPKTYPIATAANPAAGGSVTCAPNPVSHGGTSLCTAAPNAGYAFGAFSGACIGASCKLANVTAAKSVAASFRAATYPIAATASPIAGGTVTCTPNPVTHGGSSVCTAKPKSGYVFSGFGGACTGAVCTLSNVASPQSVTASFAALTLRIDDARQAEGQSGTGALVFPVTLSLPAASTVTVRYATANGTATTTGKDYVAASGTLTFAPGQTAKTIAVSLIGDSAVESDETFVVNLSAPSGATLADGQGVGTIVNDD